MAKKNPHDPAPAPAGDQKLADYLKSIFENSFTAHIDSFDRMEKMQRAYELKLEDDWGTYSQIYLPIIRTAVESVLPDFFNYLFPKSGFLNLIPTKEMSYEQVTAVREALEDQIEYKMNLKSAGYLTLKDVAKVNVGYGMIDTKTITPMTSQMNYVFGGGETVEARTIDIGEARTVPVYRYINWRKVVPMPDGDDFDSCSGVFFLDDMREDEFEDMYSADAKQDVQALSGNPKDIINHVRDNRLSLGHFPIWDVMLGFTGSNNSVANSQRLNALHKIDIKDSPVRVPILKCYFKKEHIWMTADGSIIYHQKDTVETLRCPVIRACACPDGGNLFPTGDIEAGRDAADGTNVFHNAIIDLMTQAMHPTKVVNRSIVTGDAEYEPYGEIAAYGDARQAIQFAPVPQIPNQAFSIGEMLQNEFAASHGKPRNLQGQGTAGVMRGGGFGFETLLQTTGARAKLASSILQMNWLERVVEDTLIVNQMLGEDISFVSNDDESKAFVEKTITANELRHVFNARIDMDDKFTKSAADQSMNIALYRDVISQNPTFDWGAAAEWVLGDAKLARRLRATPAVRQQQQAQLQQAQQAANPQAQGAGQNMAEQALNGSDANMARGLQ